MSSEPFDRRMHHTGFVVASISGAIAGFCESLGGAGWTQTWEDPEQRVRVAFIFGKEAGPSVELVEPVGEKSPVRAFLERGGGLHHICYEVADLEAELRRAAECGATIIRKPRPAVAFEGRRIAWILTRERLLVEFLEAAL